MASHIQDGRVIPQLGRDNAESNEQRYSNEHPKARQGYTQANRFVHRQNKKAVDRSCK